MYIDFSSLMFLRQISCSSYYSLELMLTDENSINRKKDCAYKNIFYYSTFLPCFFKFFLIFSNDSSCINYHCFKYLE